MQVYRVRLMVLELNLNRLNLMKRDLAMKGIAIWIV
jgi:hypothetical protein